MRAEDKARKDEVDARNAADQVIYQSEENAGGAWRQGFRKRKGANQRSHRKTSRDVEGL